MVHLSKSSLPFIILALYYCSNLNYFQQTTLLPIWSSCRFHSLSFSCTHPSAHSLFLVIVISFISTKISSEINIFSLLLASFFSSLLHLFLTFFHCIIMLQLYPLLEIIFFLVPYSPFLEDLLCLHYRMATFYAKRKPNLTILGDDLGIFHVTEKCLCAMFGFQHGTMHISKDDAFDDNNNITRFVYQVLLPNAHGLGWPLCASRFRTTGKTSLRALKTLSSCQALLPMWPMSLPMVFMSRTNQTMFL